MKGCEYMKTLICAKEVEALAQQGQKVMYIDADTLVTPSARDAAATAGIEFCEGTPAPQTESCGASCDTPVQETAPLCTQEQKQDIPQIIDNVCRAICGNVDPQAIKNVIDRLTKEGLIK